MRKWKEEEDKLEAKESKKPKRPPKPGKKKRKISVKLLYMYKYFILEICSVIPWSIVIPIYLSNGTLKLYISGIVDHLCLNFLFLNC